MSTPLGNEIDRLKEDNTALVRTLQVLTKIEASEHVVEYVKGVAKAALIKHQQRNQNVSTCPLWKTVFERVGDKPWGWTEYESIGAAKKATGLNCRVIQSPKELGLDLPHLEKKETEFKKFQPEHQTKPFPIRKPIQIMNSLFLLVEKLAENNLRVAALLGRIYSGGGLMLFLDLDDMGMRGNQIWAAYKNHCKEDLEVFCDLVKNRDKAMIATVNKAVPERKAVTHNGSPK